MKKKLTLIMLLLVAGVFAGCGKAGDQQPAGQVESAGAGQQGSIASQENAASPESAASQESLASQEGRAVQRGGNQKVAGTVQAGQESANQEAPAEETTAAVRGFSFADVADREFYFSSGAGAWYTVLYIHEDGTFDGHYQDADMGVTGPDYPNGTLYYSDFSGRFTEPEKVNDTTYVFQIATIEYPCGFGTEIIDGCYYDYSVAYGLDGAEDLYMYLPGTKLADLPEEYCFWVGYYNPESVQEEELPFYGLYNEKEENGFSSYRYEGSAAAGKEAALSAIDAVISDAEERAASLRVELQDAQAQADINVISEEIYTVWDGALNDIWNILKENLDGAAMDRLVEEERIWIADKEAAMQEAGAEVEGGSLYPLMIYSKAAELTKERVYELKEYLQ